MRGYQVHREGRTSIETTSLCFQVFGDKDADGFYRGESGGRTGYIPCNMVAEVAVDSPAGRQQLLQRGFLPPNVLTEASGMTLQLFLTRYHSALVLIQSHPERFRCL